MKKEQQVINHALDDANEAMTRITTVKTDGFQDAELTPYYDCTGKGVYYCSFSEKGGEITEKKERLSDMIQLIGFGFDASGEYYRAIQWRDRLTRELKTGAIAYGDIGTNWRELQSKGIAIQSGRIKRDKLADYLMTEGAKTQYLVTNQTGWVDDNRAYVLPSGEVLGDTKAKIIYNGDTSQAGYYTANGTLQAWQTHIARYAQGNSRLSLMLGASFASPLMRLLDIEGGGFHVFGDSSDGKTTIAKVALSVWGKADDLKLSWEGTGHAFTNTANARNDNLLLLDEIGQATPRTVSHTAYSVINGTGKSQGKKEGGNRHLNRWRVLMLSTGEKTLETFLQRGKTDFHAGQANRLPSIPANAEKGQGVYDTLHDMASGAELSEHLLHASNQYHGTAGRLFIEKLIADGDNALSHVKDVMSAFMDSLPPLTGQSRRVANRFALVAGALELANHYGITGLATGTASAPIRQCFDAWLAREGTGKFEDRKILEQVEAFMQIHANSYRFIHWDDPTKTADLAGYKQWLGKEIQGEVKQEYWIIPAVFAKEACEGFDIKKACEVLSGIGWLEHPANRYQKMKRGKGRFYVLVGETNPQNEEDE